MKLETIFIPLIIVIVIFVACSPNLKDKEVSIGSSLSSEAGLPLNISVACVGASNPSPYTGTASMCDGDSPQASEAYIYLSYHKGECGSDEVTPIVTGYVETPVVSMGGGNAVASLDGSGGSVPIIFNNGISRIPYGKYCLYVFLDDNDNEEIDSGEPLYYRTENYTLPEVGAIEATDFANAVSGVLAVANWGDAP